jgi:uncharacterized protein (TIGR02996 family)
VREHAAGLVSGLTGDGLALLDAIKRSPHDEQLRLVFADWLEEDGQADRAAFTREQALGGASLKTGRCREPWRRTPPREVRVGAVEWCWRGGLVAAVVCPLADWLADADWLAACHPLERVVLCECRPRPLGGHSLWEWANGSRLAMWPGASVSHPSHALPDRVLSALSLYGHGRVDAGPGCHRDRARYPTAEAALLALSDFLIAEARAGRPRWR